MTIQKLDPATIARICHETNRVWCEVIGDYPIQAPWADCGEEMQKSVIDGVKFHLANPDAPASASHDNWMQYKLKEGWQLGAEKDPDLKEHPNLIPFDKLPVVQQAKDYIFRAIVQGFTQAYTVPDTPPEVPQT